MDFLLATQGEGNEFAKGEFISDLPAIAFLPEAYFISIIYFYGQINF